MEKGLIHIYTGEGKGKTTCCVGLSVRCAGFGGKVLFSQFLKDNKSSELKVLATIPGIHMLLCDHPVGFTFKMNEDQKKETAAICNVYFDKVSKTALEENVDLLVMDEMMATYNGGFIDKDKLLNFLRDKPESMEVVMTGRNAPPELVDLADYVSSIEKVKHPFDKGIRARKGIEK